MKKNVLKKVLTMLLLITLTFFQFLYVGTGIVMGIYEELEQQTQDTSNKNVSFDAFLENGTSKVYSKEASIQTGEKINVQITIKNGGVLNDGKIKIANEGLKIEKDAIENEYIKQINDETGEIELNQVANVSKIEISIPIKFNKQDKIKVDYFSNETEVLLTGNYKDQKDNSTPVEGKIALRILWTEEAEVRLSQNVEKYLQLSDNSIMLEQLVQCEVVDNKLPKEKETIEIEATKLDNEYPESVIVLRKGKKLELDKNYKYDKETGKVTIQYVNPILDGNIVDWSDGKDIYKVIYHYSDKIELSKKTISLKTIAKTKMYTKEEIETTIQEDFTVEKMGTKNSIQKDMTSEVYKGYLYANVDNPTEYQEKVTVEVSQVQDKEDIILKNKEDIFYVSEQSKMSADTYFKTIAFEKEQLDRMLGEDYSIEIKKQDGTNISVIKNDSQVGEDGKIYVDLGKEIGNIITIKMSAPVQEGNIDIIANKAIVSKTSYTKEQLKKFEKLVSNTEMTLENQNVEAQAEMRLKDTITETKLEINQNSWSTLKENENIQMVVTLKSNTIQDDLYKNPVIKIQLPSEVSNIEFTSVKKLYADEMEITSIKYYEENNTIDIVFKGEQTEFKNDMNEGIQVVINANIILDKMQANKEKNILMTITNENRLGEEIKKEIPIQINSKFGAILYNSVENFNAKGEKLETIDDETLMGNLDLRSEEKNAKIKGAIINNYEDTIYNVCIIGRMPNLEDAVALKSTFFTKMLKEVMVGRENIKVYYSTNFIDANSQEWSENIEDLGEAKTFKIEIPEIQAGEVVPFEYFVGISADLQENQVAYESMNVTYKYNDQNMQMYSNVKFETPKKEVKEQIDTEQVNVKDENYEISNMPNVLASQISKELDGVQINVKISTPGKEYQEGDDVLEGQNIKYHITLKNNTGEDLKNFSLEGTQKDQNGTINVTYWTMKKMKPGIPSSPEVITKYIEDATLESMKFTKDVFSAEETLDYEYEFTVNSKKVQDEVTIGKILLKADGYEQEEKTMESKIQPSELKLTTVYGFNEELALFENTETTFTYKLTNITDHDLENVKVEIVLPHGVDRDKQYKGDAENYKYIGENDNGIVIEVASIKQGETVDIPYYINIGLVDKDKLEQSYVFSMNAKTSDNGITYYSNEIIKTIPKAIVEISAKQESSIIGDTIKERERVQFTTTIKNNSILDTTINIKDEIPEPFIIEESYIEMDGKKVLEADVDKLDISAKYKLKAGQEIKFIVKLIMDYDINMVEKVNNEVTIETEEYYQCITTNSIEYTIVAREDDEVQDPQDTDNQNNNSSISGTVWVDENKNGIRDEESYISGLEVMLIENTTGKIAKNSEQKEMLTTTNDLGKYFFTKLIPGKYLVVFKYDRNKYEVTQYQVENASEDENSDVVSKTISIDESEMLVAITNEIQINNNNVSDIDAGFYKKKVFDLSLQKKVGKVSAQTSKRVITNDFEGKSLAKIEIKSRELDGAIVTIEYKIRVTNEGEVDGSVKQIVDYLPQDFNFDSASNAGWTLKNGVLYNESLANVVLKPGETREISLILTKKMNKNNTGTVVNTAEICKDYNELHIADIDSVAGNRKEKEDDISSAEFIISVSTGMGTSTFIIIIIIIIFAIFGNVVYRKRKEE